MKKLLNISVIAALAVLPLAANAAVTDAEPAAETGTAAVATAAPAYALAGAHTTDGNLATAGYVKGAYNAAIKAINKLDATKQTALTPEQFTAISNVSGLSTRLDTAEGDIDALESSVGALETAVGDENSGLTKAVADNASDINALETAVGDENSGLVKDVDDLQTAVTSLQNDSLTSADLEDYATKDGVLATIDAATVPVMATWNSTTATTVSVDAPNSFVEPTPEEP